MQRAQDASVCVCWAQTLSVLALQCARQLNAGGIMTPTPRPQSVSERGFPLAMLTACFPFHPHLPTRERGGVVRERDNTTRTLWRRCRWRGRRRRCRRRRRRRALGEFRQLAHGHHQPCHLAGRAWSAAHRTQPAARQRSLLPPGVSRPRTAPAAIWRSLRARNGTSTPHTEATVGIREGFSLGHAYRMFPLSSTSPYTGARRRRERERQHDPHPQSILKV